MLQARFTGSLLPRSELGAPQEAPGNFPSLKRVSSHSSSQKRCRLPQTSPRIPLWRRKGISTSTDFSLPLSQSQKVRLRRSTEAKLRRLAHRNSQRSHRRTMFRSWQAQLKLQHFTECLKGRSRDPSLSLAQSDHSLKGCTEFPHHPNPGPPGILPHSQPHTNQPHHRSRTWQPKATSTSTTTPPHTHSQPSDQGPNHSSNNPHNLPHTNNSHSNSNLPPYSNQHNSQNHNYLHNPTATNNSNHNSHNHNSNNQHNLPHNNNSHSNSNLPHYSIQHNNQHHNYPHNTTDTTNSNHNSNHHSTTNSNNHSKHNSQTKAHLAPKTTAHNRKTTQPKQPYTLINPKPWSQTDSQPTPSTASSRLRDTLKKQAPPTITEASQLKLKQCLKNNHHFPQTPHTPIHLRQGHRLPHNPHVNPPATHIPTPKQQKPIYPPSSLPRPSPPTTSSSSSYTLPPTTQQTHSMQATRAHWFKTHCLQTPHHNRYKQSTKIPSKHLTRLGCWNTTGLTEAAKIHTIIRHMKQHNIHIMALTETHINSPTTFMIDGYSIYHTADAQRDDKGKLKPTFTGITLITSPKYTPTLLVKELLRTIQLRR